MQIVYNCAFSQLSGYRYRKPITILSSKVTGTADHTDFPVLISFTDADLRTVSNGGSVYNDGGYDIAFTSADGFTPLDFEVEKHLATTGEFLAWVKVPTLSYNTDTEIYMYYRNSTVTTNQSSTDTWNSNYKGVWHLQDDFLDATSNNNDGANNGSADAVGAVGDAQYFDGVNDYINIGSDASLNITSAVTLEAWIYMPDLPDKGDWFNVFGKEQFYLYMYRPWALISHTETVLGAQIIIDGTTREIDELGSIELTDDTWIHLAVTYDGSTIRGYVNGVPDGTYNDSGSITDSSGDPLFIGIYPADPGDMDGSLDELRVSSVARSAGWIKTEFDNQSDPASFFSVGTEEVLPVRRIWDGGGGDDNWSTAENWVGDEAPVAGDSLHFAGTIRTSPNNDFPAGTSFASITIDDGADAFTIAGNSITLTGGICNNDDSNQRIDLDMILSAGTHSINAAARRIHLNGALSGTGSVSFDGSDWVYYSGVNTYTGTTTINSGATLLIIDTGAISNSSGIINNGHIYFNQTEDYTYAGIISGSGIVTRQCCGTGQNIITLSGSNSFTGHVRPQMGYISFNTIANVGGGSSAVGAPTTSGSGTFRLGFEVTPAGLIYTGSGHSTDRDIDMLNTTGGGSLDQSGTGTLTWTGNISSSNVNVATKTFTLKGSTASEGVFSGVIENGHANSTVGLAKEGTGTWTLSGTNTYTGATNINEGILNITGSTHVSSALTVASGATLAGTGTVNGLTNVNVGGIIAPGNSDAGTLNTAELILNSTSVLSYDLGTSSDLLAVTGDLTLDGVIDVTDGPGFAIGSYTILTYTGSLTNNTLNVGSLPAGFTGSIAAGGGTVVLTIIEDYSLWSRSVPILINTTASGANVATAQTNFPLLIRINDTNKPHADFWGSGTQDAGQDIRFSKTSDVNHHFPYEIERWDNTNKLAEIWVLIDNVAGNSSTDYLTMHWGNGSATDKSDSEGVFSTSNGFAGVWHLGETVNNAAGGYTDATANNNDGTGSSMALTEVTGAVGKAQNFDGTEDYIEAADHATLDIAEELTMSVWFYYDGMSADNNSPRPLSKGQTTNADGGYGIKLRGAPAVSDDNIMVIQSASQYIASGNVPEYDDGNWHFSVGTYSNTGDILIGYFDGTQSGSTAIPGDVTINNVSDGLGIGAGNGAAQRHWNGMVDEARVSNVARSADWVKLCYETQRPDQTAVTFITSAPGGIHANLKLWLKADAGTSTTIDGAEITQWNDQSTSAVHATQAGSGNFATYEANELNYNPAVHFSNGLNGYFDISNIDIIGSDYNIIGIVEREDNKTVNYFIGTQGSANNDRLHLGYRYDDIAALAHWGNDVDLPVNNFDTPAPSVALVHGALDQSTGKTIAELRDGLKRSNSDASTATLEGSGVGYVGALPTHGGLVGNLSELMVFNSVLTTAEIQGIYSYLAVKYGFTLEAGMSYIASDGTSILWDAAANSTYHNDVTGIGRDDASGLEQQKSLSSSSDGMVILDKGSTFTSDLDFILWGNNDSAAAMTTTDVVPSYTKRLSRVWKAAVNGTPSAVAVRMIYPGNSGVAAEYALHVDADGTFASGATNYTASGISGDTITFSGVSIADGNYFTLGDNIPFPTVGFNSLNSNGAESVASADLTVDLDRVAEIDVTVDYTVTGTADGGGADYALADGQLTIPVGNSSGTITIASIIDDDLVENDETVIVTLSNPSNATLSGNVVHTYTINNDDAAPTLTNFACYVAATSKNEEVEITFDMLEAQGDEADADGAVEAFIVKTVPSGSLKIGASSASATAWAVNTNDIIDASNRAYWTPDVDATGRLDAMELLVRDNGGNKSTALGAMSQVEITFAGPDQTLCATSAMLAANTPTVGSGAWSIISGAGGSFADASDPSTTFNGTAGNSYVLKWEIDDGSCNTSSDSVNIILDAAPTADAGSATESCDNAAFAVSDAVVTNSAGISWTHDGNGSLTNSTTVAPTYTPVALDASNTVTMTLTVNGNGSCASVVDTKALTITAAPTVDAGSTAEICEDASFTVSDATVTNSAGINWTHDGNGSLTNSTTAAPTYTPDALDAGNTITLTLTVNGNGSCASVVDSKTLSITAAPTADAGAAASICENAAFMVGDAVVTNSADISWSHDGNGSLTNSTATAPTYTPDALDAGNTITLTLTVNGNGSCSSVVDTKALSITAAPTVDAGATAEICEDASFTVSDAAVTNSAGINWTHDGNGSLTNATTTTPTYTPDALDAGNTITLTLTVSGNGSCASVVDSKALDITAAPTADAGAAASICDNATFMVGDAAVTNIASINWTHDGNGSLTNSTTLAPTYTPDPLDVGNTITLTLTVNGNGSCSSVADTKALTITAAPTADTGAAAQICEDASFTVSDAAVTNSAGINWTHDGNGSLTNATTTTPTYTPVAQDAGNTVTLTLTASGNGSCMSAVDTKAISITAAPIANAGTDQTLCATSATLGANTLASGNGMWSITSGTGGTFADDTDPQTTFSGTAGESYVLTWTVTNGLCVPAADDVSITFDEIPSTASAGSGQNLCATSAALGANTPTVGTGAWSITSGAGGSFADPADPQTTFNGTAGETYVLTWTIRNGVCVASSDDLTINDITAPVFTLCPSTFVESLVDSVNGTSSISWIEPEVSDNCSNVILTGDFSPNHEFEFGNHTVTYTATDQSGNAAVCTFVVTSGFNRSPVAEEQYASVLQGEPLDILLTAYDPDGDELSILEVIHNESNGDISNIDHSNLSFTYTSIEKFYGLDTLMVAISDDAMPGNTTYAQVVIEVVREAILKISSAITLNGDGINDHWHIENIDLFPNNMIRVYDRWGAIVFQTKGYDNVASVWRGGINMDDSRNSKILPQGTYFYVIELGNGREKLTGPVEVIH